MFVQANGTYTTAPSLNAAATATQAYVNAPLQGIDIRTGTSYTCPAGGGGFEGLMSSEESSSEDGSSDTSNDSLYVCLARSTNSEYPEYADEMVFANRQLVYQLQKQGLLTHSANSVLQNFYTNHTNSNIGKFSDVRDAIAANQLALAQSKNNSINPANAVQQKTKRTNELLLKLNNDCNYKFSTTEWQDLTAMANECAVKGWYVAQSRNILNAVNGYLINYADECEQTKSSSRLMHTEESTTGTPEKERSFVLFPNPNNGNMVLTYDLGDDDQAEMHLFDVTGKLVNSYALSNHTGTLEMNEARLQNGIYFYRILVKGKTINTNKVVIIK